MNAIVVGDALTILRTLPSDLFDVTVTSPPYNKGEQKGGWLVGAIVYDVATDKRDEDEYQEEQIAVLNEIYRVTKPGGSLFYNHKIRWHKCQLIHPYEWVRRSRWTLRQEIIWYRKVAANLRGWRFWSVDERIYWLYKPRHPKDVCGTELKSRHALLTSVWEILPSQDPRHPNPFPIALPTRCIFSILDGQKGVVLDPYAGSGTTLVAAKLLGCDFLGIEISPKYARIAKERLEQAEMEHARVSEEMGLHQVQKSYRERKAAGEWLGPHHPSRHSPWKTLRLPGLEIGQPFTPTAFSDENSSEE